MGMTEPPLMPARGMMHAGPWVTTYGPTPEQERQRRIDETARAFYQQAAECILDGNEYHLADDVLLAKTHTRETARWCYTLAEALESERARRLKGEEKA